MDSEWFSYNQLALPSIQAAVKTQKITCLLNLVKLWKLLLVSLWLLMKINLLTSTIIIRTLDCFQLFVNEYLNFSKFLIAC